MLHLISCKIACERYVTGTWLPVSESTILLLSNYNTHFTLYKRVTIRVLSDALGEKALIKC